MQERIASYLADEMGEKERLSFEAQLVEDSSLREELYFHLQLLESNNPGASKFDTKKALSLVEAQINQAKVVAMPKRRNFSFLKIAATLLIVLTAGFFINKSVDKDKDDVVRSYTAEKQVRTFELSDGTVVRLNTNSQLIIDEDFGNSIRRVTLNGAANFDVTSNPDKPFIITANSGTVEVLGTSFGLEAYPQQEVELSVTEGKVKFASNTSKEEDLFEAGEKGVLSADGQELTKLELKNQNYSAWWTKRLVFDDTPLDEVFKDLEKTYNVAIDYSAVLQNCPYDAILENYTLSEALEAIQATFPNITSVNQKDSVIKLEGTACND